MPNYCNNRVFLSGCKKDTESLLSFVKSEDSHFDFNKIVPMPGEFSENESWYEWCIENWGTKWNSIDVAVDDNVVTFLTAWSPCHPIVKRLSELYPAIEINYTYFEAEMWFAGSAIYSGGERYGFCVSLSDEEIEEIAQSFGYCIEA